MAVPQGAKAVLSVITRPQGTQRRGFCWRSHSLLEIITNPKSEAERNFSTLKRIKTCTLNTPTECTRPALHWNPADSAAAGLPRVRLLKGSPGGRTAVPLFPSSKLRHQWVIGYRCHFITPPVCYVHHSCFIRFLRWADHWWVFMILSLCWNVELIRFFLFSKIFLVLYSVVLICFVPSLPFVLCSMWMGWMEPILNAKPRVPFLFLFPYLLFSSPFHVLFVTM